jgi:hypothetical protein
LVEIPKKTIALIEYTVGTGKCHFCGFEGKLAIILKCPPDLCTCGQPVKAICFTCMARHGIPINAPKELKEEFEKTRKKESEQIQSHPQAIEMTEVEGTCEICGFKGKIIRYSRPVEMRLVISDLNASGYKYVQQICNSCEEAALKLTILDKEAAFKSALQELKKQHQLFMKSLVHISAIEEEGKAKLACRVKSETGDRTIFVDAVGLWKPIYDYVKLMKELEELLHK